MRERRRGSDSREIKRGTEKEIMRERTKATKREDEMRGRVRLTNMRDIERKNKCDRKGDECASD